MLLPRIGAGNMRLRALLGERSHTLADMANLEKGMESIRGLVVARGITRDKAERVISHCSEELKQLTERLLDIDGSVSLLRAGAVA
jgi:hypothetical protein